jgi:hypothetical protein
LGKTKIQTYFFADIKAKAALRAWIWREELWGSDRETRDERKDREIGSELHI